MENFEFSTVIKKVYVGMVWLWMAPRERERVEDHGGDIDSRMRDFYIIVRFGV